MNLVIESYSQYWRRSSHRQASSERNELNGSIIYGIESNGRFLGSRGWTLVTGFIILYVFITMHKSTRTGLIGLAILVVAFIVILLLNLENIKPSEEVTCLKLDGSKTCHSEDPNPYRYYGTKTSYQVIMENDTESDLEVEGCEPVVFYLLSRHATRFPDKEYIDGIIRLLPSLKEKIMHSNATGKAKLCEGDIEKLRAWTLNMKPEDDNRLSATGEAEAEDLGQRLKERFPSILDDKYSPEKFIIEYTSRNRTRLTAENFAKGLFGEDYKQIDFDGKINDEVLTFHRSCKKFRKKCTTDSSYDLSEVEKFENGPLMKQVVNSISTRIGISLSSDDVKLIYTACVFGYALNDSDAWCSLFSKDDLEVLEFDGDIDDYYKDAYGNKVNYKQACPIAKYITDLFESNKNSNETKVVLHFSHAGAIKKVFPMFGLFRDLLPLTADAFCSEKDRKWRSSTIAPFNSNIIFVLYRCGDEFKVATFHNEKAVKVNGCEHKLCTYKKFSTTYEPISTSCNLTDICCTCCKP